MSNHSNNSTGKRPLEGAKVLILKGEFAGDEGVCLGATDDGRFAVSPDDTDAVLTLEFESEFGLLVDLSCDPSSN